MEDTLFWILWGATVSLCAWKILEGFRRPERMLEWPFLVCSIWAYFYCYMAYDVKVFLSDYLPRGSLTLGALMPLLCLAGILWGWNLGKARTTQVHTQTRDFSLFQVWWMGLVLLVVGVVGANIFSGFSGIVVDFENVSAYSYLSFCVGYPGLILALWAVSKMSAVNRKLFWVVTLVGIAAFMFPFLTGGRRGPLFPTAMVLLMVPSLANRRVPNPVMFFTGVIAAGVIMLLCLQIRQVNSENRSLGHIIQSLGRLDVSSAMQVRGQEVGDNEYLNNCVLLAVMTKTGRYQYGTGHLSLLLHWIPRALWPDKPALGAGFISFDDLFDEVESLAGLRLLGGGAAAGGVADSFIQYGYFTPVFWFGLSWFVARIFVRARWGSDPRWQWVYVGFVCVTHWLISQGAAAAFVPVTIFVVVLFVAATAVLKIEPERSSFSTVRQP